MSARQKEIMELVTRLTARSNELQRALDANSALRLRGAAIDILSRVQAEMIDLWARLGLGPAAAFSGFSDEPPAAAGHPAGPAAPGESSEATSGHRAESAQDGGGSGHTAPDIRGWLLQRLPWMSGGLDMGDVSRKDAETFQRMDLSGARGAWRSLVVALLEMQALGPQEEVVAAARRISRFWTSMVMFNPMLYMEFQGTHLVTGQPAIAGEDAPLQHWDAVMRATKFTRLQAMLVVELHTVYVGQVKKISAERAELLKVIEAETAAAATGSAAAGLAAVEASEALWPALMDSLQDTVQRERTTLAMVSLAFRAVLTGLQFGQMMALAFPYPCNMRKCTEVLAHFLRVEPGAFQPDGVLPA